MKGSFKLVLLCPPSLVTTDSRGKQQATYLCTHSLSSEFVRELCHIAVNYMLVIRNTHTENKPIDVRYQRDLQKAASDRLTSKQVASALEEIIAREDDYFTASQASKSIVPFESSRWCRPYLLLDYNKFSLQSISKRVVLGLDSHEAGFSKPGIIKTGPAEPDQIPLDHLQDSDTKPTTQDTNSLPEKTKRHIE